MAKNRKIISMEEYQEKMNKICDEGNKKGKRVHETLIDMLEEASKYTIKHINRANARKKKPGKSCAMCKPNKHKWGHKFTNEARNKLKINKDVEKEI